MTRSLPNLSTTPPNGWRFVVPETGKRIGPFTGWVQLRDQLAAHYHAAGYEMPADIFQLVVAYICEQEPTYCGEAAPEQVQPASLLAATKHTFHAAVQCLSTLMSHRAGSGERPSAELQEQRARVCAACPANMDVQGCSVCNWRTLKGLIEKLAGAKLTSVDSQLKFCAVCHCSNRAKVATKREAIWAHMPEGQKKALPVEGQPWPADGNPSPVTCWLITEGQSSLAKP